MKKSLWALSMSLAYASLALAAVPSFETRLLNVSTPGVRVQVAVGDVDADGKNELVVVSPASPSPAGPLRIYSVAKDGTTALKYSVGLVPPSAGVWSIAQPRLADADGDGDLDIALYLRADGQRGMLQLLSWDQSRRRFEVAFFYLPETDAAFGFDFADVNGDGRADAITANHGLNAPQTIFVSYGGGNRYTAFDAYPLAFNGAPGAFGESQRGIINVYARDLNADGRVDLVASTGPFNDTSARVLFNTPTGMVEQNLTGPASVDVAIGDKTGDGKLDLITNAHGTGDLRIYNGPAFRTVSLLRTPPGPRSPVIADFNGDALRDIAVTQTLNNNVTIIIGGSTGPVPITTPEIAAANFLPGAYVQDLTAADADNDGKVDLLFATDRVVLIRNGSDTTKPLLTLPANITAEATSPLGAVVKWSASAIDDKDGAVAVTCTPASGSLVALGTRNVSCSARDAVGNVGTGSFTVTVRDTTAPVLTGVTSSAVLLSPPNHKMVPVAITANAVDAADPAPVTRIIGVTSNEGSNGRGDGNTSSDWNITGALTLELRSERTGKGDDRIYTITVESRDASGNASTATTQVRVH